MSCSPGGPLLKGTPPLIASSSTSASKYTSMQTRVRFGQLGAAHGQFNSPVTVGCVRSEHNIWKNELPANKNQYCLSQPFYIQENCIEQYFKRLLSNWNAPKVKPVLRFVWSFIEFDSSVNSLITASQSRMGNGHVNQFHAHSYSQLIFIFYFPL